MFKFLKDKLKKAVESFSKSVKEEVQEEIIGDKEELIEEQIEESKKESDKQNLKSSKKDKLKEKISEEKKVTVSKQKEKIEKKHKKSEEEEEHEIELKKREEKILEGEQEFFEGIAEELEKEGISARDEEFVPNNDLYNEEVITEKEGVVESVSLDQGDIIFEVPETESSSPEFSKKESNAEYEKKTDVVQTNSQTKDEAPKKKGFFARLKDVFVEKEETVKESEEDLLAEEKELEDDIEDLKDKENEGTSKQKSHTEKEILKKEIELEKNLKKQDSSKEIEQEIEEEKKELREKQKEIEEDLDEEDYVDEKYVAEQEKEVPEKKGFFSRFKDVITHKALSEDKFNDLFWELEITLMENNVAVEVIEKIKEDLKKELVESKIQRFGVDKIVEMSLKKSIEDLFDVKKINIVELVKQKKAEEKGPFIISFIGINGSGKTTTLAKIANYFKKNNLTCVIAAADTFRVAAIEQLEEHAKKLDIKMIRQDYHSDAAAVAYDAIQHAKAKDIDVVLIDTAGRMQANVNLMEELKKLIRVAKPDLNIFIGDSVTGNDAVEQAKKFDEWVGIDGIVLSKADVDEKGGCAISISFVTKKPIVFIGTGQNYDDLKEFDKDIVLESLGLV